MSAKKPEPMRGPGHYSEVAAHVDDGTPSTADLAKNENLSRAERVLTLRIAGAPWTDIARLLEYDSVWAARSAMENYISNTQPTEEEIAHQRFLHGKRLERLLNSVMPTAVRTSSPDHLAYNARALAILDRIAALQGINAPQQQVVYTPRAEEIEKYVAHFATLAQADTKQIEADVFAADEDEDEPKAG